jgi:hypothetical protein
LFQGQCGGKYLVQTKNAFATLLRGAGFRLWRVVATETPLSVVEAVKA